MKETLTIGTINLKGGAGKSSIIVNLGGVLHESGRKPLLIDCDLQQSATRWAMQGAERFPFPIVPFRIEKNINLKQFKEKLDKIINNHKFDTILFDTPPQLQNEALLTALISDIVLIPISPSPLDLWAGEQAIETIKEAREFRRNGYPKTILVPSRLMQNTILAREIKDSLEQFNEPISPSITMRVAMIEACISGLPIHIYSPNSQSHIEFKNLLKFVFTKLRN